MLILLLLIKMFCSILLVGGGVMFLNMYGINIWVAIFMSSMLFLSGIIILFVPMI